MTAPRPVPVTDDHDTGPFFAAAALGELAVRICACGRISHLPVAHCRHCGGSEGTWMAVSGRGRVHTWTRVEHQLHPGFPTPYTILLVELEEHPQVHLLGHVAGAPDVQPGQPVQVEFEELEDGVAIPQWTLVDERGDSGS